MFLGKPLGSHLVICWMIQWPVQTNTSGSHSVVASISRLFFLWFPMSCTVSVVGIAVHFLGILTVYVGFWNLVFFFWSSVFLSLNLVLFRENRVATVLLPSVFALDLVFMH